MSDVDNQEAGAQEETTTEGQDQGILGANKSEQVTEQDQNTEQGDSKQDWKSSLPEDIKAAKSLQSIKSVEDLAKGYVNAQGVIGRRFEDLSDEQIEQYYSAMGKPETKDDYSLDIPDGFELPDELETWFRDTAFDMGMSKEAAEGLFNSYVEMETGNLQQAQQLQEIHIEEQAKQLKKDFGPAYDERVELANRALTQFGGDETIQAIQEAGLANFPPLVKLLANAGEMLAEGKFTEGANKGKFGMTSEEASDQIQKLRTDPQFMAQFSDSSAPKHKEATQKMENLYKIKVNAK